MMRKAMLMPITMICAFLLLVACQPIQNQEQRGETMTQISKVKGKAFEYHVGEYHLHITFLEENQLRWEYLAAPSGMTGKTATEEIERIQLRANQFLMMWKEADGTQVVDVLDLSQMKIYPNFVLANGDRFSYEAELVAVE